MERDQRRPQDTLKRKLGLFPATLAGMGVILGAGIYVLVGVGAGRAGNAVWLSFALGAVIAGFTAVSYARLGRMQPKNAPEFQYLNLAFGRAPGFMAGWLMIWATILSTATVALGFAGYLQHLLEVPVLAGAIGLVVTTSLVVFLGVGESAVLGGALTIIEVAALLFIIGIGAPSMGRVDLLEMPRGMGGLVGGTSLVFFAYLGFEGIANMSEEMKDPRRDLPKAIVIALAVTSLVYVLVCFSAVSLIGWEELSQSNAPMAVAVSRVLGQGADAVIAVVALVSTANTVLLMLFAASRATWAMSCAGVLPMKLCTVGRTRRTPWPAIIIVGAFSALCVLFRNIEDVAQFANFATLLAFAGVNLAALRLFSAGRGRGGVRHLLLDIVAPVVGAGSSIWLALAAGWTAAGFGVGLTMAGIVVYLLVARPRAGVKSGEVPR